MVRVSRPRGNASRPCNTSNVRRGLQGSPIRRMLNSRRRGGGGSDETGVVSRPRGNVSRPRNTSNVRRGQPSSSAMPTLQGSPIRRRRVEGDSNRRRRVGGDSDETDVVAALQLLSGTKRGKQQIPQAPTKRSRRRRGSK